MQNLNRTHTLSHLAEHINAKIIGNENLPISGLCTLENPIPHNITFIRSDSKEAVQRGVAKLSKETAAIVSEAVAPAAHPPNGASLLIVQESYQAFLNLIPLFFGEPSPTLGIHPTASVDPTASIGEGASIGPFAFVGPRCSVGKHFTIHSHARLYEDVAVGDNVTIYGGVSIRHGTQIKDRVTIHDNTVIGADGFGYTPDSKLGLRKVPQLGIVIIESDVEIGANSCIDRGTFGPTVIGRGVKIDNLCQIGHNAILGNFSIVCGGSAIGGSTKVGEGVVLGGKAGIADHLTIASGVRIGGGSAVIGSLTEAGDYMGYPAITASEWRRIQISLRKINRQRRKK